MFLNWACHHLLTTASSAATPTSKPFLDHKLSKRKVVLAFRANLQQIEKINLQVILRRQRVSQTQKCLWTPMITTKAMLMTWTMSMLVYQIFPENNQISSSQQSTTTTKKKKRLKNASRPSHKEWVLFQWAKKEAKSLYLLVVKVGQEHTAIRKMWTRAAQWVQLTKVVQSSNLVASKRQIFYQKCRDVRTTMMESPQQLRLTVMVAKTAESLGPTKKMVSKVPPALSPCKINQKVVVAQLRNLVVLAKTIENHLKARMTTQIRLQQWLENKVLLQA